MATKWATPSIIEEEFPNEDEGDGGGDDGDD
jgi:hypothetical protein